MRQILAAAPNDALTLARLALDLTIRGRRQEAEAEARRAIRLDPEVALAHYALSFALGPRRSDEAIIEAEEAIRLDPQCVCSYAQLAYLQIARSRNSFGRRHGLAALRAAESGLLVDPAHVLCVALRAIALERLSRHEEAEAAYTSALALDPESTFVHAAYGQFLLQRGRLGPALKSFREAARLDPGCPRHRRKARFVETLIRSVTWLAWLGPRLGMLRLSPKVGSPGSSERAPSMNWTTGLLLWLAVHASTRLLLDRVGDRSPMSFCLPAGTLVMITLMAFHRLGGKMRLVVGCAAGFLGLMWLELSALMFISPRRISGSVMAAWPQLHLGAWFDLLRVVGLASVVGMSLFLIAAFSIAWLRYPMGREPAAQSE